MKVGLYNGSLLFLLFYAVSDNDDLNQIQDAFDILHDEVLPEVEGKKTSKKILKQLKSWCASNENVS